MPFPQVGGADQFVLKKGVTTEYTEWKKKVYLRLTE
jgi:hypothetical protein